jgi:hypothetical protein
MKNVFVHSISNNRTSLVVAKGGTIETEPSGDKFLILDDGMRYEMLGQQADMQFTHFERYKLLVGAESQAVQGGGMRALARPWSCWKTARPTTWANCSGAWVCR